MITANTGWPAGQISEFEVYGPTTGDTPPPSAPTSLAYTQPASGQIKLTWNAATDNVGVTGYDVYANDALVTSVPGSALTYTDSQPRRATVSYFVRAHDAAGNQSGNSNSVTRTGQTGDTQAPTAPGNLACHPAAVRADQADLDRLERQRRRSPATRCSATAASSPRSAASTLTYTDTQPDTATVSYYVQAHDAAGNESAATATPSPAPAARGTGTNLAVGKPITGSANTYIFVAGERRRQRPDHVLRGLLLPSP